MSILDSINNSDENPFDDDPFATIEDKPRLRHRMSIVEVGDQIQKRNDSGKIEGRSAGVDMGKHSGVIQIINNLRAVGAQMEVDLPSIALCGQQSCGKSSLTEAICGVAMPRNAGTCTRCPTELRLIQREGPFKCDIGVRYEYDDHNSRPLTSIREQHVGSTSERKGVASVVTRAQKKILQGAGLQFSRNVITVTIYDPNCLNLTILDLPGLIFAIEKKEDAKFIDLVKGLIVDTIKKPNTLIAAVISCKDDMENQMINQLARTYDPSGSRTIGILTKVDMIEDGTENVWINILANKKYPLKLGYVAVKNPNQRELMKGLTYAQSRELERNAFNKEPWKSLPEEIQSRYGASSLTSILSDTLGSLIVKQLPAMKNVIEEKLAEVKKELKSLPPAPYHKDGNDSAIEVVFTTLTVYCDKVKNLVRMKDSDFWEDAMMELCVFQETLSRVKPRFASGNKIINKLRHPNRLMYSMEQVLEQKQRNRRRGMGCARKYFVQKSMDKWENITREIVTACSSVFAKHIALVSKQTLLPYRSLHHVVSMAAMDLLEEITSRCMEHCVYMMRRETESEFTLSTQRLHATYTNALDQLCQAFSVEKKNENQFDENEGVMIMANAIAYYDLSFRRHADICAMAIEDVLFNGFVNKIDAVMRKELNLFKASEKQIILLLDEDKTIAAKRDKALERLKRLQKTAKELRITVPTMMDMNDDDSVDLIAMPKGRKDDNDEQKEKWGFGDDDDESDKSLELHTKSKAKMSVSMSSKDEGKSEADITRKEKKKKKAKMFGIF